jgi:hypothetical protein
LACDDPQAVPGATDQRTFARAQLSQEGELVVLDYLSEQYTFQLGCGMLTKRPQTRPFLALGDVTLPIPLQRELFVDCVRQEVDLVGNRRQRRVTWQCR